jgi:hypothetical protein
MKLLLLDMWTKKSQVMAIIALALSMNLVLPVPSQAETKTGSQLQPAQTNQNTNKNTNQNSGSQAQSQQSTTPGKQQQPAADLPKTGPEGMLALFGLTSLAGGWTYRRLLLRRYAARY